MQLDSLTSEIVKTIDAMEGKGSVDRFTAFNDLNLSLLGNRMIVTDEELMSELQLGPFTRAFALAMLKLEYFTVKKSGVYSVHDNMIV